MSKKTVEVLIASGNANKIEEFRVILKNYPVSVISPRDLVSRGVVSSPPPEVDEAADNYLDNARLKAKAYFKWSSMPVLADDSGLEVVDLDNRPGVLSARYAGEGATEDQKMDKVLAELAQLTSTAIKPLSRQASFRCALVYIDSQGQCYTSQESMPGVILREKVGNGGFGYDPIVHINELGKTLAEIDFETTCTVGFRARATRALFDQLALSA